MRQRIAFVSVWAAFSCAVLATASAASGIRELTFEERVEAQRAIEQVYWKHRVWPESNSQPKPPLSATLTDDALRAKVDDYLRKSNAMEAWWDRPIAAPQLRAEMERMVRQSQAPEILAELFAALANDPFVIAETLGRQKLADRLVRNWFAFDDRIHGETRERAEAALAATDRIDRLESMGGEYQVATWRRASEVDGRSEHGSAELAPAEWRRRLEDLSRVFGADPANLPVGRLSRLHESAGAFVVTAVLARGEDAVELATVTWPKQTFDSWWSVERAKLSVAVAPADGEYEISQPMLTGCGDDTWYPVTPYGQQIEPRSAHSAVWTGSEMIVWGGSSASGHSNSGARYDPATDTWVTIPAGSGVPSPRANHTAVWTGSEMIVWGGGDSSVAFNTGGRYDPLTDTWQATSTGPGVPSARLNHTAVWTGSEMIVWGGGLGAPTFHTGGRYDPATDSWQATLTGSGTPASRQLHSAVWTGTRMIVWGGKDAAPLGDGGMYDPLTNAWQPTLTAAGVPSARFGHTAVWTGSRMIVWGGEGAALLNTGGRFDPASDSWQPTSPAGAPSARRSHDAVWTGTRMIVWGGYALGDYTVTGGRYDPAGDAWQSTAFPSIGNRESSSAVWTGVEMIVWGGRYGSDLNSGARYNPSTDSWVQTAREMGLFARDLSSAVWTGSEMIVWGGQSPLTGYRLNTGGRYEPATAIWTETSVGANVPSARSEHAAVWTGTQMVIWGGTASPTSALDTGGRYNVSTDTWLPTSLTWAPAGRGAHTAVWTGTEMIVWGGGTWGEPVLGGGRYNPLTNTWRFMTYEHLTSFGHSAVWTGTHMIIWGGMNTNWAILNYGQRYDPVADTWTPTSLGPGVPTRRIFHSAVWTGTEMIIWGGGYDSGARYDPVSDTWVAIPAAGAPTARSNHSAVWTGDEMIVWGGEDSVNHNTGGRYHPASNSWRPTSTAAGVPPARSYHAAVWTGTHMIVFGGSTYAAGSVAGAYCAVCPDPDGDDVCGSADNCPFAANALQEDTDGDSFGDACDCGATSPAVYPGAPELCDGVSNDCSSPSWPALPAQEADADADGLAVCQGDCNDADPMIRPGAAEVPCNGVDDDCDGTLGGEPIPYYPDGDADGWGLSTSPVFACAPPSGMASQDGDCDDSNPAIHPTAPELACNGVDEDCDGHDGNPADADGDGVAPCDNCPGSPNPSQMDSDGDALGDDCDNCPQLVNPGQSNTDGDQRGDLCDTCPLVADYQEDFEGDGVGDACDNCPYDPNRSQANFDGDLEGDACDLDDGLIVQFRVEPGYIEWRPEAGYSAYHVYEGDLTILRATGAYTQAPGANPLAQRTCVVLEPWIEDFDAPPQGAVQFSLVTGIAGGIEATLGSDSSGAERPNTYPCGPSALDSARPPVRSRPRPAHGDSPVPP